MLFCPRNRYQFLFSTNVVLLAAFLFQSSSITFFETLSTCRLYFFLLPSFLSFLLPFFLPSFFFFLSFFLSSFLSFLFLIYLFYGLACFVVFFLSFFLSFILFFRSYLSFFMVWRDHRICISLRVSTMKNEHGLSCTDYVVRNKGRLNVKATHTSSVQPESVLILHHIL